MTFNCSQYPAGLFSPKAFQTPGGPYFGKEIKPIIGDHLPIKDLKPSFPKKILDVHKLNVLA